MSTLAETTLVMKRLSSAYGQPVDVDRARAYHQVLGQYPRMVLAEAATLSLTRGSQYLPKPVELMEVIQKSALVTRFHGIDKFDERAFWLAYAKGYISSDEFSQADIDTVYSGMDGYEPYKSGGAKDETKGSYEYFKQLRKRGENAKSV